MSSESYVEAKTVLDSAKSSAWRFFKFRVSGDDVDKSYVLPRRWPPEEGADQVLRWYNQSDQPSESLAQGRLQVCGKGGGTKAEYPQSLWSPNQNSAKVAKVQWTMERADPGHNQVVLQKLPVNDDGGGPRFLNDTFIQMAK